MSGVCCVLKTHKFKTSILKTIYLASLGHHKALKMQSNTIQLVKKDGTIENIKTFPGLTFDISGINNRIRIYEGTRFKNSSISVSSNSEIEIKNSKFNIVNLKIYSNEGVVEIGENFSCWGVQLRGHEQGSIVKIGSNCMFSSDIFIYPTDVHTIFDQFTGDVLNESSPVIIGNHVWCGRSVTILKGSVVRNDVVIGSGSLLTKVFNENNIVIGGSPAQVLKRGVNWSRESPTEYEKKP